MWEPSDSEFLTLNKTMEHSRITGPGYYDSRSPAGWCAVFTASAESLADPNLVEAYQACASYGQHELSHRGNMTSFQSFTAA